MTPDSQLNVFQMLGWHHGNLYHDYQHKGVSTCNSLFKSRQLFPWIMQMMLYSLVRGHPLDDLN